MRIIQLLIEIQNVSSETASPVKEKGSLRSLKFLLGHSSQELWLLLEVEKVTLHPNADICSQKFENPTPFYVQSVSYERID